MYGSDERRSIFRVSRGDTAPSFQMQESVFYQVTQAIKILVVVTLDFAVLLGRYHDVHVLRQCLFDDFIAIVPLVGHQPPGINSVYQGFSLLTIVDGTCCNKYSDRHTIRIHGQMYFGVKPPFVRSMS